MPKETELVPINMWNIHSNYPSFILGTIPMFWMSSQWFQTLTCVFSIVELSLPLFDYLLQGWYWGTPNWLKAEGSWFLVWALERGLSNLLYARVLFHMQDKTWGVQHTGPIKRYHDQTAILYIRVLAQEPEESGGPEAKDGENYVHQIVQHIWWIFLHQYQHISRTAAQDAPHITIDVWGWEHPKWSQTCPFAVTGKLFFHTSRWASGHYHGHLALTHTFGRYTTHSEPTWSLIMMALSAKIVAFWVTAVFQRGQPKNIQCEISSGVKICGWKRSRPEDPG